MVDPQTRTVPLLAQTNNHDGLLKLGMFVQILLDSSSTESVLTVPDAAVVEIEGQSYVFVPAKNGPSEHTFSPRPVEIGRDDQRPRGGQGRPDQGREGRLLRQLHAQERADPAEPDDEEE